MTLQWSLTLTVVENGMRYHAKVTRPRQLYEWALYRNRSKVEEGLAAWEDQARESAHQALVRLIEADKTKGDTK